jgi:hypothetical protein
MYAQALRRMNQNSKVSQQRKNRTNGYTGEATEHLREKLTVILNFLKKKLERETTFKPILSGQHHPDMKDRQKHYTKTINKYASLILMQKFLSKILAN